MRHKENQIITSLKFPLISSDNHLRWWLSFAAPIACSEFVRRISRSAPFTGCKRSSPDATEESSFKEDESSNSRLKLASLAGEGWPGKAVSAKSDTASSNSSSSDSPPSAFPPPEPHAAPSKFDIVTSEPGFESLPEQVQKRCHKKWFSFNQNAS